MYIIFVFIFSYSDINLWGRVIHLQENANGIDGGGEAIHRIKHLGSAGRCATQATTIRSRQDLFNLGVGWAIQALSGGMQLEM